MDIAFIYTLRLTRNAVAVHEMHWWQYSEMWQAFSCFWQPTPEVFYALGSLSFLPPVTHLLFQPLTHSQVYQGLGAIGIPETDQQINRTITQENKIHHNLFVHNLFVLHLALPPIFIIFNLPNSFGLISGKERSLLCQSLFIHL